MPSLELSLSCPRFFPRRSASTASPPLWAFAILADAARSGRGRALIVRDTDLRPGRRLALEVVPDAEAPVLGGLLVIAWGGFPSTGPRVDARAAVAATVDDEIATLLRARHDPNAGAIEGLGARIARRIAAGGDADFASELVLLVASAAAEAFVEAPVALAAGATRVEVEASLRYDPTGAGHGRARRVVLRGVGAGRAEPGDHGPGEALRVPDPLA